MTTQLTLMGSLIGVADTSLLPRSLLRQRFYHRAGVDNRLYDKVKAWLLNKALLTYG